VRAGVRQYSIRKLHLDNANDLLAELKGDRGKQLTEFSTRYRRHEWTLKVICREREFPKNLLSAFSLRGIACWLAAPGIAYLFVDDRPLRELAADRSFMSSTEVSFAAELRWFLENHDRDEFVISTQAGDLILAGPAVLMGILNCTPDSFYEGGRYETHEQAVAHGLRMAESGADIIDVGGESTRPRGVYVDGALPVTAEEEIERVVPVIAELRQKLDIPISIDTYKASVAEAAIEAGATMVNDISGFLFDEDMPALVARRQVPVVIMHIKGTPQNMQDNPTYDNLFDELYMHLEAQIELALQVGIPHDQIIVDPGLGFGKRIGDNYEIIRRLPELRGLGCPILVGPSRKSFVGEALDLPPDQRLEGTAAAVALSVMNGARILRVHDVEEMRRVVRVAELIAGRVDPESHRGVL